MLNARECGRTLRNVAKCGGLVRAWQNVEEHGRICLIMAEQGGMWKNIEKRGKPWRNLVEHGIIRGRGVIMS